jgi:hypothetical protein
MSGESKDKADSKHAVLNRFFYSRKKAGQKTHLICTFFVSFSFFIKYYKSVHFVKRLVCETKVFLRGTYGFLRETLLIWSETRSIWSERVINKRTRTAVKAPSPTADINAF